MMNDGITMIANVRGGRHYVLAYCPAGDGKNILVQDPGHPDEKYDVASIVGWVKLKIGSGSKPGPAPAPKPDPKPPAPKPPGPAP